MAKPTLVVSAEAAAAAMRRRLRRLVAAVAAGSADADAFDEAAEVLAMLRDAELGQGPQRRQPGEQAQHGGSSARALPLPRLPATTQPPPDAGPGRSAAAVRDPGRLDAAVRSPSARPRCATIFPPPPVRRRPRTDQEPPDPATPGAPPSSPPRTRNRLPAEISFSIPLGLDQGLGWKWTERRICRLDPRGRRFRARIRSGRNRWHRRRWTWMSMNQTM